MADASPWDPDSEGLFGFRLNAPATSTLALSVNGDAMFPRVSALSRNVFEVASEGSLRVATVERGSRLAQRRPGVTLKGQLGVIRYADDGDDLLVFDAAQVVSISTTVISTMGDDEAATGAITSPMPGRIVAVQVAKGDHVAKGAPLLTLEAMKMEHVLTAPFDAVVAELDAVAGAQVAEGVVLARLEPA